MVGKGKESKLFECSLRLIIVFLLIIGIVLNLKDSVKGSGSFLSFEEAKNYVSAESLSTTTDENDYEISTIPDDNDYQLAYDQSFGFFTDVSLNHWRTYQDIVSKYVPHKNPNNPREYAHNARAFYQTNYEPNFSCPFEMRIGGNGDGGKWVCDPHRLIPLAKKRRELYQNEENSKKKTDTGCLIYSVGSEGDLKYEIGMQKMLNRTDICEIHVFDFGAYEHKIPKGMNIQYHRWGLEKKNRDPRYKSLEETIKSLGHENRPIDIFKIDCESCEWSTFKDWFGPKIPMLQQILVETHNAPRDQVLQFFDGVMDEGYVMFHKEPNIQFAGGDCVEFAFLKLHDGFFAESSNFKKKNPMY